MAMPRTPHDGLFKLLTDHPEAVAALVRDHLPAEIAKRVVAVRHADNRLLKGVNLAVTQSDCLLEVTLDKGDHALVYVLMEHKAHPDPRVLFQVGGYVLCLAERLTLQNPDKAGTLPPIIPLILYHGRAQWDIPRSLRTSLTAGQESFGLELNAIAVNLGERPVPQLASHPYATALLYAMLHISGAVEGESYEVLVEIFRLLRDDTVLSTHVATYVRMSRIDETIMDAAIKHANPEEGGDIVRTSAERLMAEGHARGLAAGHAAGRAAGRAEVLALQLTDRFGDLPDAVRQRLETASPEAVSAWALAFPSAKSLQAVFKAKPKAR